MRGVRGKNKKPGSFRTSQNWIGGASLRDALFVPPPSHAISDLISDLEKFLHNQDIYLPALVRIGIAHYQFETIHPFLDGNGRIGRLMITLYLVNQGLLPQPALYLSDFFERNRLLYYDNLQRVRVDHRLHQWLRFFMVGVIETSQSSIKTFDDVLALQSDLDVKIASLKGKATNARKLLHYLFRMPVVRTRDVQANLGVTAPTAHTLIGDFVRLNILEEQTGYQRNRIFHFTPYLRIFGAA